MAFKPNNQLISLMPFMLICLQLLLPTIETRQVHDRPIAFPTDAAWILKQNATTLRANQTEATATMNATMEASNNTEQPDMDIGFRIALDTLPICPEGFKLINNHCRKAA